jgi:hypothetical protein
MKQPSQHKSQSKCKQGGALAVRFPLPSDAGGGANARLLRLSKLLPRQWRRQVVIQGQRFWLPG